MTVVRLESSSKLIRLLLLGGVATALIAVPAAIDGSHPGIAWQTALAKNDGGQGGGGGNGDGHGKGQGGEHGRGGGQGKAHGQKQGYGHSRGNSPDTATYDSFGEFMGKVQNRHGQAPDSRRAHDQGQRSQRWRLQESWRAHSDHGRARQTARLRRARRCPPGQLRHAVRERHCRPAGAAGRRQRPLGTRPKSSASKTNWRRPSRMPSPARGRTTPGQPPTSMSMMTGWSISATSTLWMSCRSAPPARTNPAR